MQILRKLLLLLGWIRKYKPSDLCLLESHHKTFYKVLNYLSIKDDNYSANKLYPLTGNNRLYLKNIKAYKANDNVIYVYLNFAPRKVNLNKYRIVNSNSIIHIKFNIDENGHIRYDNPFTSASFEKFEYEFYHIIGKMNFPHNMTDDIMSLDGYGDILVMFNKILSFNDLDKDVSSLAINNFDIEPICSNELIKKVDYQGIKQFNLIVNLNDGIGNNIIVKSYHQDNKLKLKIKSCISKLKIDMIKLSGIIDDIKYMLDEKSIKNLDLYIDINEDNLFTVMSNNTPIISFNNEDDFNSFIIGAKDSFKRIFNTGICKIIYDDKAYTCFKGVLNNGIIEYIAISGDVRIQTLNMKYDPIKLRT